MSKYSTVLRLLAASVKVAEKSGTIVRSVLSSGELGIVVKVTTVLLLVPVILIASTNS